MKQNFPSSQLQIKFTQKLIPNFNNLQGQIQYQISKVLGTLLSCPDKKSLQHISRLSLLEQAPLLHSHLWKLLLETLPRDCKLWDQTVLSNHQLYVTLVDKFLGKYIDEEDLLELSVKQFDENLWGQIQLDTKRTHSALNFFQKQIKHTKIYLQKQTKNFDIMSRILYVWGKINPTVRYVQGMNQILAPLYFLQFQCFNQNSQSQVFFMFASVMTFVIDMHIKQMDDSAEGIMGKMKTLDQFLKVVDYSLWNRLNSEGIVPHYYSFRWLALLLAQQFGILETMKLWDQLLSFDGYKRYFLLYCFCIAILKLQKQIIMESDFIVILPAIQKIRGMNILKIIQIGTKIYQKYSKFSTLKGKAKLDQQKYVRQKLEVNFMEVFRFHENDGKLYFQMDAFQKMILKLFLQYQSYNIIKENMQSQLFAERSHQQYQNPQTQLQFAKLSLIARKKYDSSIHSILFCKPSNQLQNFPTINQKSQLTVQKKKYVDYIRKNFKDKIPQDFQNYNKLKTCLIQKKQNKNFSKEINSKDILVRKKIEPKNKIKSKNSNKNEDGKDKKLQTNFQNIKNKTQNEEELYSQNQSDVNLQIQHDEQLQSQYQN